MKTASDTPNRSGQPVAKKSSSRRRAMRAFQGRIAERFDGERSNGQGIFSTPSKDGRELVNDDAPTGADWLVWQIADSAFPTGGFAHSNGLEAAWQLGEIRSAEELVEFVKAHLSQTGRSALPFINEAYHENHPFAEVDRLCDVFLSNHVANRSSRAQGQAFLFTATQTFEPTSLKHFRTEVLREKLPGHLAPVFGTIVRMLELSHMLCSRLYLFLNLRTLMASAVRLGIVGPLAGQALQRRLNDYAETIARRCSGLRLDDVGQTSPLLDILQGAHDRLYSRLFQT